MMETFKSVEAVLDFAIEREEEAFDLYHSLASRAENKQMQQVFTGFAEVEAGHKRRLEGVKEGETYLPVRHNVTDLKISDYLVAAEPSPAMSFQDALVLAMKREEAAKNLYNDMAASCQDELLAELFRQLAKEEATHKSRFEIMYDEYFLTEN